jgi:hypothetical protein
MSSTAQTTNRWCATSALFDELKKALAERMRMAPRLMSSRGFGHLSKNDFMANSPSS